MVWLVFSFLTALGHPSLLCISIIPFHWFLLRERIYRINVRWCQVRHVFFSFRGAIVNCFASTLCFLPFQLSGNILCSCGWYVPGTYKGFYLQHNKLPLCFSSTKAVPRKSNLDFIVLATVSMESKENTFLLHLTSYLHRTKLIC